MRIGIVSPSKISYVEEVNSKAKQIISDISKDLAKKRFEIVVTPDKGSVSEFVAQEYIKSKGKKVWEIIPLDDKEWGYDYVNTKLGEIINCNIWRNQPEKFNEETDALIVIGYTIGGLTEMAYTKWLKPKTIYIIKELISKELPEEFNRSLDIKYISYKELDLIKTK